MMFQKIISRLMGKAEEEPPLLRSGDNDALRLVLSQLVKKGGVADLTDIYFHTEGTETLQTFLAAHTDIFKVAENRVHVRRVLSLCKGFNSGGCWDVKCEEFHVCELFLRGGDAACSEFRGGHVHCFVSHLIESLHNLSVLQRYSLSKARLGREVLQGLFIDGYPARSQEHTRTSFTDTTGEKRYNTPLSDPYGYASKAENLEPRGSRNYYESSQFDKDAEGFIKRVRLKHQQVVTPQIDNRIKTVNAEAEDATAQIDGQFGLTDAEYNDQIRALQEFSAMKTKQGRRKRYQLDSLEAEMLADFSQLSDTQGPLSPNRSKVYPVDVAALPASHLDDKKSTGPATKQDVRMDLVRSPKRQMGDQRIPPQYVYPLAGGSQDNIRKAARSGVVREKMSQPPYVPAVVTKTRDDGGVQVPPPPPLPPPPHGMRTKNVQPQFPKTNGPQGTTWPAICQFYHRQRGCRYQNGGTCKMLHICKNFATGHCRFGPKCRFSHDILDDQNKQLLLKHGVDAKRTQETVEREMRIALRQPDTAETVGDPRDATTGQDICMFNLRGKCNFDQNCRRSHVKAVYMWQHFDNGQWRNFTEATNSSLEKSYCDAQQKAFRFKLTKSINTQAEVTFDDMTMTRATVPGVTIQVRRLSTPSSAKYHNPLATEWKWYWPDNSGVYMEFGADTPGAQITSATLEAHFVEGRNELQCMIASHNYVIDIQKREQRNVRYGTVRRLRRRPVFRASDTLKVAPRKVRLDSDSRDGRTLYPKTWDLTNIDTVEDFELISLDRRGATSREFRDVESKFLHTMDGRHSVSAICRVQNPELWADFHRKMERMNKKLPPGKLVDQKQLFHGTNGEFLKAICQQGFDWRVAGSSSGAVYGKGSYFARDASYSRCYTDCKAMFLARVLVGAWAKGSKDMVKPPPKDPANPLENLFDSCVNNVADPSIYVVFRMEQAYPEYLIRYE